METLNSSSRKVLFEEMWCKEALLALRSPRSRFVASRVGGGAHKALASVRRPNCTYVNWLAAMESKPLLHTVEYPLYSDAYFAGETSYGPYHFLNTTAGVRGTVVPAVVLRFDWHWEFPAADFSQTDSERYHGGTPPDELAALASLALGVRFRAGDSMREFDPHGDPKGHPRSRRSRPAPLINVGRSQPWVLPRVVEGDHTLEMLEPLSVLPKMSAGGALSLVRASRLYQDALWLAESEAALSWLLFVSALETAAQYWRPGQEEPLARFQAAKPELFDDLLKLDSAMARRVAEEFNDSFGATRKFLDFVLRFRPAQPTERPSWGGIDWSNESLRRIVCFRQTCVTELAAAGGGFTRPYPGPHSWSCRTESSCGAEALSSRLFRKCCCLEAPLAAAETA